MKEQAKNTKAAEMTYERIDRPSRMQQRQALAQRTDELTSAELRSEAERIGVDTAGATKKDEIAERVRGGGL